MSGVFAVFAAYAAVWLADRVAPRAQGAVVAAIIAAIAIVPALTSYRLVSSAADDTH